MFLAAAVPFLGRASVAAGVDLALEAAWAGRDGRSGTAAAVSAYEQASRRPGAPPAVFGRLLRLRFFQASQGFLEGARPTRIAWSECVQDGLRGLMLPGGQAVGSVAVLHERRFDVPASSLPTFYWTVLCYGNTIPSLPLLQQARSALRFRDLLKRAVQIDGSHFFAGPHRNLAEFLKKAPGLMGGDDTLAAVHADTAVRMAPDFAENRLVRAQNVWLPRGERQRAREDLEAASRAPDSAAPDAVPEQRDARERARRLLADLQG